MKTKLPVETVQQIDQEEAAKTIRGLREKAGMSIRRLAAELGFSAAFVSDMELGRRNWSAKSFTRAIDAIATYHKKN